MLLKTNFGDPMKRYQVRFRASKRRVSALPRGMLLWPKAIDAVLTRHMDLEPEARIRYVGEVEAPDPDECHAAIKMCYEHVVIEQTRRLPTKPPTKPVKPRTDPWPADED